MRIGGVISLAENKRPLKNVDVSVRVVPFASHARLHPQIRKERRCAVRASIDPGSIFEILSSPPTSTLAGEALRLS